MRWRNFSRPIHPPLPRQAKTRSKKFARASDGSAKCGRGSEPATRPTNRETMSTTSTGANGLEIAIVGLAGRFPGAKSVAEFWRNLVGGVESIRFFSDRELAQSAINPALLENPNYVPANGVLDDSDLFDAAFFKVNASEAEVIDPQHRIFLELAWEAIENAGYDTERYKGSIGVYAGTGLNTYLLYIFSRLDTNSSIDRLLFNTGNDKDFIATRVSYK